MELSAFIIDFSIKWLLKNLIFAQYYCAFANQANGPRLREYHISGNMVAIFCWHQSLSRYLSNLVDLSKALFGSYTHAIESQNDLCCHRYYDMVNIQYFIIQHCTWVYFYLSTWLIIADALIFISKNWNPV